MEPVEGHTTIVICHHGHWERHVNAARHLEGRGHLPFSRSPVEAVADVAPETWRRMLAVNVAPAADLTDALDGNPTLCEYVFDL
ncbi:hypothetical protein [Streptosporangium sp. LJ11]|uniref:hypothetical protein n=1 Tax=Streptosporangium sp. LJ11 TaxID=3436927 RepID=UPI003F7B2F42